MSNKNILMIDGSYMGHRSMYTLSKKLSRDVLLDTQEEMTQFEDQLFNDVIGITKSFDVNIGIDNVLVFVDGKSWRHGKTMIKPYYETDDKLLGYKENRKSTKEKSKVDWENYHDCLDVNFVKKLNAVEGFHASSDDGFEADDNIYLSAKYLSEQGNNVFIFANDGDYEQAVINANVYYFRNNKSKEFPLGTIIVHKSMLAPSKINLGGVEILKHKMKHKSNKLLDNLSKIDVGSPYVGTKIRTVENNFIRSAEPLYFGFVKSIIGDKKDNILPIIGRYSATNRLTRVLEKNIILAFDLVRLSFENDRINKSTTNNELVEILLSDFNSCDTASELSSYSQSFLKSLIIQLKEQKSAKNIFNHLKLNIDLMILEMLNNSEISDKFEDFVLININENLKLGINLDIMVNKEIKANHDILIESIPDVETPENGSIDDILDSAMKL